MGPGEVILMVTPTIRNIMGNNVHKKSDEKATSNIRFISLFSIFPKGSLRMLRMGTLPIISKYIRWRR